MNPLLFFLLLFAGIPLVELYFLLKVGGEIGAFSTVFLVILTAVIGAALVRRQGFSTLMKVRASLERNEVPALEMLEGAVLMLVGLMLLLPGFVTDVIGFILLVPPWRRAMILSVLRRARVMTTVNVEHPGQGTQQHERRVIEGEYRRED